MGLGIPSFQKMLRLPRIPSEVKRVQLVSRFQPGAAPQVTLQVEYARPLFGWVSLLAGVALMATVVCVHVCVCMVGGGGGTPLTTADPFGISVSDVDPRTRLDLKTAYAGRSIPPQ